jgi:hypothetical protein
MTTLHLQKGITFQAKARNQRKNNLMEIEFVLHKIILRSGLFLPGKGGTKNFSDVEANGKQGE